MTNEDYEFMLTDRIAKIQAINEQHDLLNNSYISFSGGKDSVVLSKLIDLALPNNKIPRVFANTGIEHNAIRKFVLEQKKNDDRFIILTSKVNIPRMLKSEGYPFKSKQHSQNYGVYFRNKEKVHEIIEQIEKKPELKFDYDFIHNLGRGTKSIIKYFFGVRERERELYEYADYP